MSETLEQRFERKIKESFASSWGHRAPLFGRLTRGAAPTEVIGGLSGALEIYARAENGSEALVHRETFENVDDDEKVDDVIAEGLSIVLMKHPQWPR